MTGFHYNFPPASDVDDREMTNARFGNRVAARATAWKKTPEIDGSEDPDIVESFIDDMFEIIQDCESALRRLPQEAIDKYKCKFVEAGRALGAYGESVELLPFMTVCELLPPLNLALCYSAEEVREHMRKFGLAEHEIPRISDNCGEAITFEGDERFVGIARVKPDIDDRETMMGLLVHEGTHIATRYLEHLGIEHIDDEVYAYVNQGICQALIEEHLQRKEEDADDN